MYDAIMHTAVGHSSSASPLVGACSVWHQQLPAYSQAVPAVYDGCSSCSPKAVSRQCGWIQLASKHVTTRMAWQCCVWMMLAYWWSLLGTQHRHYYDANQTLHILRARDVAGWAQTAKPQTHR